MTQPVFEIKRRRGQRTIRVCVHPGGRVSVSAGLSMPRILIERFLERQRPWIERAVARLKERPVSILKRHDPAEYKRLKKQALKFIEDHLAYFNQTYQLKWKRVSIRNQKSQWGSCSKSGTLSFNYKLLLIPPELADYVIVHELCHVKEMNHSHRFWALIAKAVPDWRERRRALKKL